MKLVSLLQRALEAPFTIPGAGEIADATRVSVAAVVLAWCLLGPFTSFYPTSETLLYSPVDRVIVVPALGEVGYSIAWWATVLGCVAMMFPRTARPATILAAGSFLVLNGYVSGFSAVWNYNTHLNLFLFVLCFAKSPSAVGSQPFLARHSAIVFFMRAEVAMIYFQAGLAKLVHGGLYWGAETPYFHLVYLNAPGAALIMNMPELIFFFGYVVIFVEIALGPLFIVRSTQRIAACTAIALHLSFWVFLGISFWHLWALYFALFLYQPDFRSDSIRV